MPFEPKDAISLVVSAAAFGLAALSYFQKKVESTQSLRKRLTDVLKELTELNLKDATFRNLEKKDGYPPNYIGLLADQRRFFIREAASLSDSLGKLVSSHEKNLIAGTFDSMDYVEEAGRFFKSAAETSPLGVDRGLAMRNYARFLYRRGLFEEGETAYFGAIEAFSGDDDRNRFYRMSTYTRWAENEFNEHENVIATKVWLDKAREEAKAFKNVKRGQAELKQIEVSVSKMLENRPWALKHVAVDLGAPHVAPPPTSNPPPQKT